ncbi:MAG: hypothetical protein JWP60_1142 [Ramlibacter sp.]|nr:hypothetical protein [Ramlibacter sp.]
MAASLAKIEAEALQLSAEERVRLADHLLASVAGEPESRRLGLRRSSGGWLKSRLAHLSCSWKTPLPALAAGSCEDLPQRTGGA